MLRTALARASRAITATAPRVSQLPVRRTIQSPFASLNASNPITRLTAIRCYASGSGLNQEEVTGRILDLLKNFDKVREMCMKSLWVYAKHQQVSDPSKVQELGR